MYMSFDEAWENEDYRKIMNSISYKYRNYINSDDIESEQMLVLWKCLKTFNNSSKFTTYLYTKMRYAMINLAIKNSKKVKNHNFSEYGSDFDVSVLSQLWYEDSSEIDIEDSIQKEHYDILYSKYIDQLTMKEMAKRYNCKPSTARKKVEKSLTYATRKLKRLSINN